MILSSERAAVVEFGRKLLETQLTTGTGGNLSIFNRAEGLVAIKPTGVDYGSMRPEDVVVMTPDGRIVDGTLKPSSEFRFHLDLYRTRADVNAVVHTHQVYATTIACMGWELPAVHYLVGFSGDKVPLAAYAVFGSQELSDNITGAIGQYNACLMANHGIVTVGDTLAAAFSTAEALELVSRLYYQTKCIGQPVILNAEQMAIVGEKFKGYGQQK